MYSSILKVYVYNAKNFENIASMKPLEDFFQQTIIIKNLNSATSGLTNTLYVI